MKKFIEFLCGLCFLGSLILFIIGFEYKLCFIFSGTLFFEFLSWNYRYRLLEDHDGILNKLNVVMKKMNIDFSEEASEINTKSEEKEDKDA